jgi:hypothetical protein
MAMDWKKEISYMEAQETERASLSASHGLVQFIAFDWCGWNERYGRFTALPSGDTIICQGWMGQHDWDKAQLEWFKRFDGAVVVHRNTGAGPYRETGDLMGTVAEIVERLVTRVRNSTST